MSELLGGVIHGRTIELESDSGLTDGERVEVVIHRATPPRAPDEGIRSTAGALSHPAPEDFEDLDEIVRDRWQQCCTATRLDIGRIESEDSG